MDIPQILKSPVSYQGGKARLAKQIVEIIYDPKVEHYYDLCCGSGAVSLELIKKGVSPSHIHMVDQGPWGLFWKAIGEGSFSKEIFKSHLKKIPQNLENIQGYVEKLAKQPANNSIYVFLVLQATSFGSKPIWIEDNKWKNCSFRNYWKPTATSKRRSPVNPMMPMPGTLYDRVSLLVDNLKGLNGYHQDIHLIKPELNSVVYIDPPYKNRTAYGHDCDAISFAKACNEICYVSEGSALSKDAILLSRGRAKGGVSGNRRNPNEEWLNIYR